MRNRLSRMMWASCLLGASAIAGCAPEGTADDEPGGQGITQVHSALGTVVPFGLLFEYGMRVDFAEIQNPDNVNTANIQGLAACDAKSLYVLVPDTTGLSLFYSFDGGLSFVRVMVDAPNGDGGTMAVPAQAKSLEIACDDRRLFTLDTNRHIFYAYRTGTTLQFHDGASNPWIAGPTSPLIDHIQGGDGTLYGVQDGSGLHPLYKATTHSGVPDITWSFVSNVGSKYVSGGGNSNVSDRLAWPRRAFSTAPDGTSAFNDTILDGQNVWPDFNTGSERFSVLSAATTNLLYGLDNKTGSIRLVVITLKEDNCTDGVDNDADGRTDSEDSACVESAAVGFCALSTTVNGTYCVDRYQPATFLDQPNQNAGLVTCSNHLVVPPGGTGTPKVPKVGACAHGFGTHSDRLLTEVDLAGHDPAGTARYCNMIWPSTQLWDFAWGTSDPCGTIRARNPSGGVVVRAGLFTTTGNNNVLANCANGGFAMSGGAGTAPLQSIFNVLGHGPFGCTIIASPTAIPVWSQPFPLAQQAAGSPGHCNHTWSDVDLAQFGHGESGTSSDIDRNGFSGTGREHAYDITLPEGTPLYAMHGGTVVMSRDRNVMFRTDCSSSYQGEVWVRNFIGDGRSPAYQENIVAYYAHLRRRVVETGQTVRAGQLLGFSGETGCASAPHVHLAVHRNSNINAHTATSPQFGYHVNFEIKTIDDGSDNMGDFNLIDAFGWGNQAAFDPSAYLDRNSTKSQPFGYIGLGGWSMDLFIDGQRPHL